MNTLWMVLKKSTVDVWDEMLYLILFNIMWIVGTILIIPAPFVSFGLFFMAYDVGIGKSINPGAFFAHGRRMLKPAYIWGGINLVVFLFLWFNIRFYGGIEAQWAAFTQVFFASLTLFWLILQAIMLALYPRLTEPGFRLALRNAAILIGKHPVMIFSLLIVIALIWALTLYFQIIILLLTFSVIAVLFNNMVGALVDKELAENKDEG